MSIRILPSSEVDALISRRTACLAAAEAVVGPILEGVQRRGDLAVAEYAAKFDHADRDASFVIDPNLLAQAAADVPECLRVAMTTARGNIEAFARAQMPKEFSIELGPGHSAGQIVRPIGSVACYVPGGRYPMPSTVLMTAIPARVAGVPNIWVTAPKPIRETLAASHLSGVTNMARIGGAQAIAAFAFGTESIPKVDRIVGPGNLYVAAAKKLLAGDVGIDFVAGPSEVLIVASSAHPVPASWIAADMLAQAEHDPDASAILITTSPALAEAVAAEIERQLMALPTAECARAAIVDNGAILRVESEAEALELANRLAPEHLCLHDSSLLAQVTNAGSVFVGPYSPEAAGDYCTGPNHVLPTAGTARIRGGLSVMDFLKVVTTQELTEGALSRLSPAATTMARAEGLEAHAKSIEIRLEPEALMQQAMGRWATVQRITSETQVWGRLSIEGRGRGVITTGIGFFDHMLELFAKHGAFDLDLNARGDLSIDQHHSVEDVGIVLGTLFDQALGDRVGIHRSGYFVQTMDEALAVVALDLGGRASCVVDAKLAAKRVGDLVTENLPDFFEGFARAARANVHVKVLYGRSSHHKIEALFKGFGRALRFACSRDDQLRGELPSTKGLL